MTRVTRHQVSKNTKSSSQELLYDPDVATPSHAEQAKTLVAQRGIGTLCTLHGEHGHPYGSFVTYALVGGNPVFLVSKLAEHTRNLEGDPKASLLVNAEGKDDPLANARVTLIGACTRLPRGEDTEAREAFLAAHPNASYYVDFKDFSFFQLDVESLRYIGGYGRMSWVTLADWQAAQADPIAAFAPQIIEHMNDDHAEAMIAYCQAFSRASDTKAATMTAIDRYGFEMSAVTEAGPRPIRLAFAAPIENAGQARTALVALVKQARAQLAQQTEA